MSANSEQAPVKRRSKGEKTKKLILASAIDMLAKLGIKGTTHRAIAAHANIQLSLTTYYFKDIQHLIQEAFELNSQNATADIPQLWRPILALLAQHNKVELRRVKVRLELQQQLTNLLLELINLNIKNHRDQLIVEQQLLNEIQFSPALRLLAEQHNAAQLKPCMQVCQYFNKDLVKVNAQILLTLLKQAQYHQLLANQSILQLGDIRTLLQQTLAIVLGIKPQ
tara:strand:- start:19945 stop:20616 length:672 start_codon:yes stop_codon:yes gene_type:complete